MTGGHRLLLELEWKEEVKLWRQKTEGSVDKILRPHSPIQEHSKLKVTDRGLRKARQSHYPPGQSGRQRWVRLGLQSPCFLGPEWNEARLADLSDLDWQVGVVHCVCVCA